MTQRRKPSYDEAVVLTPYRSPGSGVDAYQIGDGWIRVRFGDTHQYLYTDASAGVEHVAEMARRARTDAGLNTYINQHVRERYARRER